jgi:hypothetical protein
LYLRPTLIDGLLQTNETIVTAAQRKGRNNDNKKQDCEYHPATHCEFAHREY